MDDYKLHPKDKDFLNTLYSINDNTNINGLYYSLYNSVKRRSAKSLLELLLNIINYVDNHTSINILHNIIPLFRYDNYSHYNIELKLISHTDLKLLVTNNAYLLKYIDNKTLLYYEILTYTQTKYITDISDVITIEDIDNMTDKYINDFHNNEYNRYNITSIIEFAIYHINYINTRDDYNFNNKNYHILFLQILKHINNISISTNIFKLLFQNITHTAIYINNIMDLWFNMTNEAINLDEDNYLEYQMEIIDFLSLCSYDKLKLYYNNDLPDELISCFALFQTNIHKLINETSILNIYSRCRIIELNHTNNAWNDINNMTELIKFYIQLEKYNGSTGFDSREKIRFYICKILISMIAYGDNIIRISINDTQLLYKFMILILNENYKNIEYIKNYSEIYDETKITIIETIQMEFYTISMYVISKMIILFYHFLNDKWLNYLIYDIVLWWDNTINLFIDDNVDYLITDILNADDNDLLFSSKKNIIDFLTSFVNITIQLLENPIILNKWNQYAIHKKEKVNLFCDFIKIVIPQFTYDILITNINNITDISNNIDDIPNEFLDPLVYELIETPIVLPVTNVIVDEKIIFKHIILKGDNPYNREELDMNDLIKYQENSEIINIVNEWKDKYNKWKGEK
jgi:hypothetical protein